MTRGRRRASVATAVLSVVTQQARAKSETGEMCPRYRPRFSRQREETFPGLIKNKVANDQINQQLASEENSYLHVSC